MNLGICLIFGLVLALGMCLLVPVSEASAAQESGPSFFQEFWDSLPPWLRPPWVLPPRDEDPGEAPGRLKPNPRVPDPRVPDQKDEDPDQKDEDPDQKDEDPDHLQPFNAT